jgi:hypothetical protein
MPSRELSIGWSIVVWIVFVLSIIGVLGIMFLMILNQIGCSFYTGSGPAACP